MVSSFGYLIANSMLNSFIIVTGLSFKNLVKDKRQLELSPNPHYIQNILTSLIFKEYYISKVRRLVRL